MSLPVWIVIGVLAVTLLFVWMTYNALIVLAERIKEALSSIDIQLKRRIDLIPNLIETVKGYAKHEKGVLESVTKARTALMSAETLQEKAKAENMLEKTLKSLFAVAESYPDLKASNNFLKLQEELADTENKIAYSRQFYNANVLEYNMKLKTFPTNIIANLFKFGEEEFFVASEEEKKNIKVDFGV